MQLGICYQLIDTCPAGKLFANWKTHVKLAILIAAPSIIVIEEIGQMRRMRLGGALQMMIRPSTLSMEYLKMQCRKMSYPRASFTNTSIVCGGDYNS